MKPVKIAVITGASSGMGREFVKQIDKKCLGIQEIWLIARRKELMQELDGVTKAKLRYFPMDLTKGDYSSLIQELQARKGNIKILVNSAGYGRTGSFTLIKGKDNTGMVDLNCKALTGLTYEVLPYLSKGSYIINLASAAAFLPQPDFAVYAATKSYVLSFSRGLNRELRERGIWVSAVCPGPVNTEFFDLAEETGAEFGLKKIFMADKEKVVAHGLKQSFKKREVVIYSLPMKMLSVITKVLPQGRLLDAYSRIGKMMHTE